MTESLRMFGISTERAKRAAEMPTQARQSTALKLGRGERSSSGSSAATRSPEKARAAITHSTFVRIMSPCDVQSEPTKKIEMEIQRAANWRHE